MSKTTTLTISMAILAVTANFAQGTTVDLTTINASVNVNGAIFEPFEPLGATGTGLIDSFLRIQAKGNNNTESGYNTDGKREFDSKGGNFTHSLKVGAIPTLMRGGIEYGEILLDLNDTSGDPSTLELTAMKVFIENTGDLSGYPSVFAPATYDLDAGSDSGVLMDATLTGNGSGFGDVIILLPKSVLGSDPNKYFYLYSEFTDCESGFEEWAVSTTGTTLTPEPTMLLLLVGAGVGLVRRRSACC